MLDEEIESPFALIARHQKNLPVDVEAIAHGLGIKIYRQNLGDNISGQLIRDRAKGGSSGFAVYINLLHHPNRQRFTLAHEIAHFILHRDLIDTGIVDDTFYRSDLSSGLETQANRLAADILMPIMIVKRERARGKTLEQLATQFSVSKAAMEIRLKGFTDPLMVDKSAFSR